MPSAIFTFDFAFFHAFSFIAMLAEALSMLLITPLHFSTCPVLPMFTLH